MHVPVTSVVYAAHTLKLVQLLWYNFVTFREQDDSTQTALAEAVLSLRDRLATRHTCHVCQYLLLLPVVILLPGQRLYLKLAELLQPVFIG